MPGFGPATEVLLFRQKDPKPLTSRPPSPNLSDAGYGEAAPTRYAHPRAGSSLKRPPRGPDGRRQIMGRVEAAGSSTLHGKLYWHDSKTRMLGKLFGITIENETSS